MKAVVENRNKKKRVEEEVVVVVERVEEIVLNNMKFIHLSEKLVTKLSLAYN